MTILMQLLTLSGMAFLIIQTLGRSIQEMNRINRRADGYYALSFSKGVKLKDQRRCIALPSGTTLFGSFHRDQIRYKGRSRFELSFDVTNQEIRVTILEGCIAVNGQLHRANPGIRIALREQDCLYAANDHTTITIVRNPYEVS